MNILDPGTDFDAELGRAEIIDAKLPFDADVVDAAEERCIGRILHNPP